jgi:hypothetical protein
VAMAIAVVYLTWGTIAVLFGEPVDRNLWLAFFPFLASAWALLYAISLKPRRESRLAESGARKLSTAIEPCPSSVGAVAAGAAELRSKLSAADIPPELHDKFVEFQERYAGHVGRFNLNTAVWGILLDRADAGHASALVPGQIEAFEEDGVWQVVCADIHASDTATVDQHGRLYWSYQPWYSDFNLFFAGGPPDLRKPRATSDPAGG